MSTFEIVCLTIMAAGALLIIGAVGYNFVSKAIVKYKNKRKIEDEISRFWQNRYGTPPDKIARKRQTTAH